MPITAPGGHNARCCGKKVAFHAFSSESPKGGRVCNTACKPCSAGPPGNQGRRKGGINCPQTPEQLFSSIRADNEGTTPGGTRHSRIKDTEKPCSDLAEKICSIFIKTCSAVKKPPGNALLQNSVEAVRGTYGFAPAARRQHPVAAKAPLCGTLPASLPDDARSALRILAPARVLCGKCCVVPADLPCRRPCSGGVISALDACKPCPARQQTRPLGKAAAWSASKLSAPAPPALEGYFRHSPATQPLKIPAAKCCR